MPGGLLNLVSYGNQNVILNGTPSKTFFKTTYSKYTNFGLQKFRIDFSGLRSLRLTEESKFSFKVPRYADLLMETYFSINLPTVWSPIYESNGTYSPYEFRWIENLGVKMIKEVVISVGGQTLQRMSGDYMLALVQRDFDDTKKEQYNRLIGNIAELNDPANAGGRVGTYPNAKYNGATQGPEPSIRGRKLYIPLNAWFSLASQMAFPLVSLQYNELQIEIVIRPVREMFTIIPPGINETHHVQPNFNETLQAMYRFLQPPPENGDYTDKRSGWNADPHLLCTYGFLSEEEVRVFAADEQKYLIKEVHEYNYENVTGSKRVLLNSMSMVSSYMWFFQRSDINLRNQWSNYSNWEYMTPPNIIDSSANWVTPSIPNTSLFQINNEKNIMLKWSLLLDGKFRENPLDGDVLGLVEKYNSSDGFSPSGLYCYNFCLHTSPFDLQPSGAMNMSKFNNVEFEFTTFAPPLDPEAQTFAICDPVTGDILGVNKPTWRIYNYNYDLTVMEERYNTVIFSSGNVGLMYARS
ncbi:MAG: hypothetical protein CL669_04270 [Balneola sp.]|nr:hypothetical protein [Balneola sp.]